ncbi:hypothetical protein CQW23_34078 [Capsicum baccatum]|uniref:NB-ARC domain-containing protein n=1 Tax=Capsicum baccatum TaxID=33114 RepID=A0A2G2V091_CAPBA|nr:hypothetical protein CQW23_34078 [Capsicum baccatum]
MERYWFPKLDFLTELDCLWVAFESSKTNHFGPSLETNWSWDFHFPSNLKILKLCDFPLTSDSLSTIARLPNLKELLLITTIIKEEEWNMGEEDTFLNLKCLGLNDETLAKWEFGEESFPVLEKLALWECRKLTKIPPNFGDIDSLKIIELFESPQLEDSALEIKQCVEDITGVDKLQILDPNNIPLSKTVSFILSLSKSRTLPCFPKLLCHAQFTPSSWRAAAMPSSASLLLPNASDFNCLAVRVSSTVSLSLKHTWCFPEFLRDALFTPLSWRAAAMPSSASFFNWLQSVEA